MNDPQNLTGVEILAPLTAPHAEILTADAIAFLADLQQAFNQRRKKLLAAR